MPRRSLPWARPKYELLLLVLVAVAALSPIHEVSAQDVSRLCLTRALLEERLTISPCVGHGFDRAQFAGRVYSDKAPGMSVLAVPATLAVRLPAPRHWQPGRDIRVWAVRVLTSGIAFIALAFAVGRLSEGIAPGTGGVALVTFALGTIAGALAATTFGHVTGGAAGFAAFLLAWRRSYMLAGLVAGAAVCIEYQTGLIALVVALYASCFGWRPLGRYLTGLVPGGLLLAGYDWSAFGSPLHLSYRYVANIYSAEQSRGLFGISWPRWNSIEQVFVGDRGVLVVSPVLIAAGFGLVLLSRRHKAEAIACSAIVIGFVVLAVGYFLPYGGVSPGPRFLVPALPFAAVGLGPVFDRLPRLSVVLAVPSLVASTALTLTWSLEGFTRYRYTVWGELARLPFGSGSRLGRNLASNIVTFLGAARTDAVVVVVAATVSAFGMSLMSLRLVPKPARDPAAR